MTNPFGEGICPNSWSEYFVSVLIHSLTTLFRHLDHGYKFGWGTYTPGQDGPPDRPHTVERLHFSLQMYPATFLRPHYWREMVPGCSVAIHVRNGMLLLRIFVPPDMGLVDDRQSYFTMSDMQEEGGTDCVVAELYVGDMM